MLRLIIIISKSFAKIGRLYITSQIARIDDNNNECSEIQFATEIALHRSV